MRRLVRTELAKLRATRGVWGFVAVFLAIQLSGLGLVILNAGRLGAASPGTVDHTLAVLGSGGTNSLVLLVLGVLMFTGELRHRSITTTLLVTPSRRDVLAAKAIAITIVGVLAAIGSLLLGAAVGLTAGGLQLEAVNLEVVRSLAGLLLLLPVYGLLGIGLGALIRQQTAAVVLPLVWFIVVEPLIPAYGLRGVAPWTPDGATAALAHDPNLLGVLPPWAGALLLLGYASVLLAAGWRRFERGDIT